MTREEAILWLVSLAEHEGEEIRICAEDAKALQMGIDAIKALEQEPITWIVGKDNCQVAVRNMPIDKMQKICAIIGEEEQQPYKEYDYKALWEQVEWERDVAIEQLEQLGYSLGEKIRTSEDCVSRKEGINAVKDLSEHYANNQREFHPHIDFVVERLEELPPVTPQPKWIPVSERLPSEIGMYLITKKYMYIDAEEVEVAWFNEHQEWLVNDRYIDNKEVIAWMPQPQPYKEDAE